MKNYISLLTVSLLLLVFAHPTWAQDGDSKKLSKKERKALEAIQEAKDLLHITELKSFEDSA
ncbi:MAG: hypothetical protein AAFR59_15190, partial [Bacteroidota bacterium]